MKNFLALLFFLPILSPLPSDGSPVYIENSAEAQVSGGQNSSAHAVVETTVNGETTKIESSSPGKIKLEFKKIGENSPTVSIQQEGTSPSSTAFFEKKEVQKEIKTWPKIIFDFFQELRVKIFRWFRFLPT